MPLKFYDQDHCQRLEVMKMFRKMNQCRVLPLYGTLDLVTNDTLPICRSWSDTLSWKSQIFFLILTKY